MSDTGDSCLVLLGDSHTRSFRSSRYVSARVFLAPGKKNNFVNFFNLLRTFVRYKKSVKLIKAKNDAIEIGFVIGEPDLRWLSYRSWYIEKGEDVLSSNEKKEIKQQEICKLGSRFRFFLFLSKVFSLKPGLVVGCCSPNPEMSLVAKKVNCVLEEVCHGEGSIFFNPSDVVIAGGSPSSNPWIGYSVFNLDVVDYTHCSSKLGAEFDRFVEKTYGQNVYKRASEVSFLHELFKYKKEFQTFYLKEPVILDQIFEFTGKVVEKLWRFKRKKDLQSQLRGKNERSDY